MKTKIMICTMVLLLSAFTGSVFGGTEGNTDTFYGYNAGASTVGDNHYDTFIGSGAGFSNTTGFDNTFLGNWAGNSNTTGYLNTFLGYLAGWYNTTGIANTFLGNYAGYSNIEGGFNTFLGNWAGYNETGSNKLYIANSSTGTPLIYGEFDNNKVVINGNLEVIGPNQGLVYLSNVTTDNTTKFSRLVLRHYSNTELPVYLFGAASTSTNNFVAFGGGNTIGNAATQIDLFTAEDRTTPVGTARITIKGNGYVGIGTQTPSYPLQMAGGAYTNGSIWVDASSRDYKEDIEALNSEDALKALGELKPVRYAFKTDRAEKHVGFVAEEVPELVATKDRRGLSPMDIVAVLTKVVQEQQKVAEEQQKSISMLSEKVTELERELRLKGTRASVD